MRINFRHGLISFQRDAGNPKYLQASTTAGFISQVVSPTPTIIAVAHGGSDYLVKFDDQVDLAWQITSPVTTYLYWDIDQLTAEVTRGTTILIPVSSVNPPPSPANDQHWFDLSTNLMKVWSSTKQGWKVKIRLFAGHVVGGNTANIVQFSEGSTIGLNTPCNPAFIMLDTMLQPLRKNSLNGEFLTDEDETRVLATVGTSGVLVQPVSRVVPVRAGEAIPRMSLVYFSDDDTVRLADSNPALIPGRPPVGLCIDAVANGEIATLVQSGEVMYDQWDWSGSAGSPVYCDSFGQMTLTRPAGLMAFRVGFVKNPQTVLVMVDSETSPQVYSSGVNDLIVAGQTPVVTTDAVNGLGERVVTISVPPASLATSGLMTVPQVTLLNSLGSRITTAEGDIISLQTSKADVSHTHSISSVVNLQPSLDALTSALNGKADKVVGAVAGNIATLNGSGNLVDSGVSPASFSQVGHVHTIPEVSGLQASIDQKAFRAHLNMVSEIYTAVDRSSGTDIGSGSTLQSLLDGKSAVGHTHGISDVTNLQTTLDDKAPVVHVHAIANVTGLQSELDNRAYVSHNHAMSQVTGLVTALAGKADVSHNHALSTLTDVSVGTATEGQVLTYVAGTWEPTTVSGGSFVPSLPSTTVTFQTFV